MDESDGHYKAMPSPEQSEPTTFPDEVCRTMKEDQSKMTTEELFRKWEKKFTTVADFYKYFEITDPPYEEFYQQKRRETYGEFLSEGYLKEIGLTGTEEQFELEIFLVEERDTKPRKKKAQAFASTKQSKLRIISNLLPMNEIGLGNVQSDYYDLSVDLFDRLKKNQSYELLRRILAHLIQWEQKYNKKVIQDGNIISQRENQ